MFLNGKSMKFPQQFRAGDFIQWRLDSTTDNFGDPETSLAVTQKEVFIGSEDGEKVIRYRI